MMIIDIPESIQQIESLIETEELSASGRNFMQQDKQIPDKGKQILR